MRAPYWLLAISALCSGHFVPPSSPFGDHAPSDMFFGDLPPGNLIPLTPCTHTPLTERSDLFEEIFQPQDTIEVHYAIGKKRISSLLHVLMNKDDKPGYMEANTLWHDEAFYVNLEKLEPLLRTHQVRCEQGLQRGQAGRIALLFNDETAVRLAEKYWAGRKDILFVAEHESCFEGPNHRSIYQIQDLVVDMGQRSVIIHGIPQRSHVWSQDKWATDLTKHILPIPDDLFLEHRTPVAQESGISEDRRSEHMYVLTSIECRAGRLRKDSTGTKYST